MVWDCILSALFLSLDQTCGEDALPVALQSLTWSSSGTLQQGGDEVEVTFLTLQCWPSVVSAGQSFQRAKTS